ncbi:molybdate ABC transporter substrate-binding protein [Thalassotalea psychrophila]|uniref:Molybdate ABC transporter substrate-binding protein n=1 Tax=Thalassotalea psychrophila TaxID=3065647 RepID=A0ABY9TUS7_9GAMM|nr:molybdate ABC transporter substrate-binding protein [Colwelliaceae bacterium SQ149]
MILSCATYSAHAEKLRIAVSANFALPVEVLVKEFKKTHPFTEQISVASTGVLYQQIRHGAPFDIFLAADLRRPQLLEEQGLIFDKYRKTYAIGQLALWSATSEQNISLDNLKNYDGRIAAAGPHIAPYGLAAKETLMSLNLWTKYHQKLIVGNNINQTYQQIHSGAVTYGFISYSQLLNSKIGHGVLVDDSLHHALEQQMVVLKHAENVNLATQFFEFLLSNTAQKIISQTGYLPAITIPEQDESESTPKNGKDNTTEIAVASI